MRKLFNKLQLSQRIGLFTILLIVLIFSSLGYFLYQTQQRRITENLNSTIQNQLDDLIEIINTHKQNQRQKVEASMYFAEYMFSQAGTIQIIDSALRTQAVVNEKNGEKTEVTYPAWYYRNSQLQDNHKYADQIRDLAAQSAGVFQKIPQGYLNISTSILKSDGSRAVYRYIPNNTPVVQAIENGQKYRQDIEIVSNRYTAACNPLYINGEIKGMLFTGSAALQYAELKKVFESTTYFNSGYPFMIDANGEILIHPFDQGESSNDAQNLIQKIKRAESAKLTYIRYQWKDFMDNVSWKIAYFRYYEPLDAYVCASVYENDLFNDLENLRLIIVLGILIAICIVLIGVYFILKPLTTAINVLVNNISELATGNLIKKMSYHREDEVGKIVESLNTLIDNTTSTARFAKEIEKGNFDSDFTPLSRNDVLGNSLLDMRQSLKKAQEEEIKRKIEDQQRKWVNEGLAKFGDILRLSSRNIEMLAIATLKELVRYMEANQGGIFIVNDSDKDNMYLELKAAFAYNREKHYTATVQPGEGLVGVCAIEKNVNYLTNIPDEYIAIRSGLGGTNPRCLLLVPLIHEEQTMGVIEIASFKEMADYQLEFVKKIAEDIASSVANVKINERTNKLLEESKRKSEEMASQEEEMRQNLEELQATQEEVARKDHQQKERIEQLAAENEKRIAEIEKKELESKAILNALNSTTLLFEYDFNGGILFVNDIAARKLGKTTEELIGQNHTDLLVNQAKIEGKDAEQHIRFWDDLKKGEIKHEINHFVIEEKDLWLSETYTPVFDKENNPYKVLKVSHDITQEKLREIELKEKMEEIEYEKESSRRTIDKILKKSEKKEEKLKAKYKAKKQALENCHKLLNEQEKK